MSTAVRTERLCHDIETLATFSRPSPGGGVTRPAWSEEFLAAEGWLVARFEEAGLSVHIDAARNVWGRWEEGALPAVVAGSHIDSVPSGGAFDGCLGVLGALEAVRSLREAGHRPRRQIWVVAWTEEEGSAFGNALFGSRAMAGDLDVDAALQQKNDQGETLEAVMKRIGHSATDLARLSDGLSDLAAYLELHIEQGPILEQNEIPVGIVSDIVGLRSARLHFTGRADHAGTTPMSQRRDAGLGLARTMIEVRDLARTYDVRATTGKVETLPGGTNVIPGRASLTLDVRHREASTLRDYVEALQAAAQRIADDEGLHFSYEDVYSIPPAPLYPAVQHVLNDICQRRETPTLAMVSGAGHDAMALAPHLPTGMIFIPSRDGISHAPDEFSTPEQCATGVEILAEAMARLSEGTEPWMT